jgi:choline-glycine betaine transporter
MIIVSSVIIPGFFIASAVFPKDISATVEETQAWINYQTSRFFALASHLTLAFMGYRL